MSALFKAQIGEDTIWADIDESHVYKEINVDDLEKTFKQMVTTCTPHVHHMYTTCT